MEEHVLIHYGVKGMKWGVRRYEDEYGNLTDAGKIKALKNKRFEARVLNKTQRRLNRQVKKGNEVRVEKLKRKLEKQMSQLSDKYTISTKKTLLGGKKYVLNDVGELSVNNLKLSDSAKLQKLANIGKTALAGTALVGSGAAILASKGKIPTIKKKPVPTPSIKTKIQDAKVITNTAGYVDDVITNMSSKNMASLKKGGVIQNGRNIVSYNDTWKTITVANAYSKEIIGSKFIGR